MSQKDHDYKAAVSEERKKWKQKIAELKMHLVTIEVELIQRQKKEMEALREKLESSLPTNPKPSSELLKLRLMKETLAKQKNYIEAMKAKEEEQKLAEEEDKQWKLDRTKKIIIQETQLMQRHAREREAHKKRKELALLELKKEKSKKIQYIEKNYKRNKVQNPKGSTMLTNKS